MQRVTQAQEPYLNNALQGTPKEELQSFQDMALQVPKQGVQVVTYIIPHEMCQIRTYVSSFMLLPWDSGDLHHRPSQPASAHSTHNKSVTSYAAERKQTLTPELLSM